MNWCAPCTTCILFSRSTFHKHNYNNLIALHSDICRFRQIQIREILISHISYSTSGWFVLIERSIHEYSLLFHLNKQTCWAVGAELAINLMVTRERLHCPLFEYCITTDHLAIASFDNLISSSQRYPTCWLRERLLWEYSDHEHPRSFQLWQKNEEKKN